MIKTIEATHGNGNSGSGGLGGAAPSLPTPYVPENDGSPSYNPDDGSGIWGTINNENAQQMLTNLLTYYDNHPTDPMAIIKLTQTIAYLVQNGLFTKDDATTLSNADAGNLMKDVTDQMAEYAFLYGYNPNNNPPSPDPGTAGSWAAVTNYVTALQTALQGISPSNSFITQMISETQVILGQTPPPSGQSSFEVQFMESHSAGYNGEAIPAIDAYGNPIAKGDIIWSETIDGQTIYFDFTSAQKNNNSNELDAINTMILNSSGATGDDQRDIDNLNQALPGIQTMELLATFDSVYKETGDVGLAIMAMIFSMEGNSMNQISGNSDTMDKQTKLSKEAKALEDYLNSLATPSGGNAGQFRGDLTSLFTQIESSSQFTGLQSAVDTAVNTLDSTMIPFPAGSTTMRSVWSLATDPTVSNKDLQAALSSALNPSTSPTGAPSPSPTSALQGLLGGVDGVVTAVSSASTQANTVASQLEALVQAMDKVMTGVIDPNNGMNTAVIKTTLTHQTGN